MIFMIREIYELVCFSNSSGTTVHKFTLSTTHNPFRCIFFTLFFNFLLMITHWNPIVGHVTRKTSSNSFFFCLHVFHVIHVLPVIDTNFRTKFGSLFRNFYFSIANIKKKMQRNGLCVVLRVNLCTVVPLELINNWIILERVLNAFVIRI
jgi:hypothetical protein